MGILIFILVLAGAVLMLWGYQPFIENFQRKFGRSFIHWSNISLIILIFLSLLSKSSSAGWTVIYYIAWAVFIGLGIWQMIRYGFLWGLGVWFYNILTVALVIVVINMISNFFKKIKEDQK